MKYLYATKTKWSRVLPIAILFLAQVPAYAAISEDLSEKHVIITSDPVRGWVSDDNGKPISGAKIVNTDTGAETVSGASGDFVIDAEAGNTLSISYNGKIQTAKITGNTVHVVIPISEKVANIQKVILVGYGSMSKSDMTGAVSQLKASQLKQGVNISADNLL